MASSHQDFGPFLEAAEGEIGGARLPGQAIQACPRVSARRAPAPMIAGPGLELGVAEPGPRGGVLHLAASSRMRTERPAISLLKAGLLAVTTKAARTGTVHLSGMPEEPIRSRSPRW